MKRESEKRGFLEALATANGVVAVTLFVGLTLVVALQVFTRFVLHLPFIWSEEMARFLFFWVVLLGSSLSVRQRRHFVIDIGMGREGRSKGRGAILLDLLPDLCVLGFSVLLLVQGVGYAKVGLLRVAPNSQLNMVWVYAAIPTFAALTLIYACGNLLADLVALGKGRRGGVGNGDDGPPDPGGS